jgi:hypothetical protein
VVSVTVREVVRGMLRVLVPALTVFEVLSVRGGVLVSLIEPEMVPVSLSEGSSLADNEIDELGAESLRDGETVTV